MRIATWNVDKPAKSGPNREKIMQLIKAQDADIWVLTESDINLSPGEDYCMIACSSAHAEDLAVERNKNAGAVWTTIWARLYADRILTIADPDRTAAALVIPEDDAPLLVYGTVLPWNGDTRSKHYRGFNAFTHVLDVQATEWTSLIAITRQQHPEARLCVAGDFNQEWTKDKYVSEQGRNKLMKMMDDPRHPLVCATGLNDPLPGKVNRHTIDHICISGPATDFAVGFWPPTAAELKGLSDHYGLWLDLPKFQDQTA
jgi:endonuclease/exonuclease/phosphatase family metal-dependent hydrolase